MADTFEYKYPIFDQTNQEITDPDLNLGYLRTEKFTVHHPLEPELWHYKVVEFEFSNKEVYKPESEDDPHIRVVDATKGIFDYVNLDGEDPHTVIAQDVRVVIDRKEIPAYDEEVVFYRYVKYTEKELSDREFLAEGPAKLAMAQQNLEDAQSTIDDLLLMLAELVGGEEEEPTGDTPIEE